MAVARFSFASISYAFPGLADEGLSFHTMGPICLVSTPKQREDRATTETTASVPTKFCLVMIYCRF